MNLVSDSCLTKHLTLFVNPKILELERLITKPHAAVEVRIFS